MPKIPKIGAPSPDPFDLALGIPGFRDDIAKWNKTWESHFPRLEAKVGLKRLVESGRLSGWFGQTGNLQQQWLLDSRNRLGRLSLVQTELRVLAVTVVFQPDFCWKTKLTDSAREGHMLEGLMRTCLADVDINPMVRMYTCDITLSSLLRDNGEGFFTVLRRYVPANGSAADLTDGVCMSYPHPRWTQEDIKGLKETGCEAEVQACTTLRDLFLSSFLHFTILSVFGVPRPPEFVVKEHWGTYTTKADWTLFNNKRLSNSGKNKNESSSSDPIYRLHSVCSRCRETEREGIRFSVCKVCREKLGRMVSYCSRECQVLAWPIHKTICGKRLTSSDVLEEKFVQTESARADDAFLLRMIGPAQNGYQRSPALIRQIQFLNVLPSTDYVYFSDTGPHRLTMSTFLERMIFRLLREIAMSTGDPECIAALFEVVLPGDPEIFVLLAKQLSAEYGIDAVGVLGIAQSITKRHPSGCKALNRWTREFLGSKYGSSHAGLWKVREAPSFELTRKVIQDLREWKQCR